MSEKTKRIIPTLPEEFEEKTKQLTKKQLAFSLLRKQGLSIEDAGVIAGYDPKYSYSLEKNLTAKYDLTSEFWLKKSQKALKSILAGEPVGSSEKPKCSDVLGATKMVYDRAQPVVHRNESLSVNAKIDLVDLTRYKRGGDVNVDVEPTSVET